MKEHNDSGAAPMALENKISRWNYNNSIEKMRPLVKQWKKATVEMLRELYLAREHLTRQKGQYRDPEAPNYLEYSWSGYCGEIGLSYQTANAWLRYFDYVPREVSPTGKDTLLLLDAPPKEDSTADRALTEARISEVLRTNNRPSDWTDKEEAEVQRRLKNAQLGEIMERYNAPVVIKSKDYFEETLRRSKDIAAFKLGAREQTRAQMAIFEHIERFLATFDDPATKAQAAFNVALKARRRANELAEINFQLEASNETNNL